MIIKEPILSITGLNHFEIYLSLIDLMQVKKDKNGMNMVCVWPCLKSFNVNKMNTYGNHFIVGMIPNRLDPISAQNGT